jgi:hypothetical protein
MMNIFNLVNGWTIINLVGFNLTWLGLILFGNNFIPIALVILMLHLYYQAEKNELKLIFIVVAIGVLLDSTLLYSGIFIFPSTQHIPLWLIVLWCCFAATIRHSLGFLSQSKILQLLAGGVVAPLSYLAGAKFSAVYLTSSLGISYLLLACIWGPLMVLIFLINDGLCIEEECYVR